ncbi:MAG: phage portal protein [Planctomycetes bacterium]|nr:phage portal protein [Planctomycetota bacterium]
MGFELDIFKRAEEDGLEADYVEWLVDEHSVNIARHFGRLWEYYANPMAEAIGLGACERKVSESGRCYVQAQEYGLPSRITGLLHSANAGVLGARPVKDVQRKEVVIENDIAWRINAAVDFLFGKPISFVSKSPDGQKRAKTETILKAVFAANGGISFFQDMAVLGSVYGFVDCFVRPGDDIIARTPHSSFSHATRSDDVGSRPNGNDKFEEVLQLAQAIGLELVEAPRALPVLDEDDYKITRYYVQHFHQKRNALSKRSSFLSRILSGGKRGSDTRQVVAVTEITSAAGWQRYEDKMLVAEGELPWGFLPVVHIQNIAQPYYYEGLSDVEPLIPLQDELNTRLSDRASRITFQSFKMYLGKGIEGFENKPISPGRMWYTDNPEASIEEFGGDTAAPSEGLHIAEMREAMDKSSGVTPVVAGILKGKVGNLTSAVALRLTLMGMLSKNERKRFTYSEGLKRICRTVLSILDTANIYKTCAADREVDIVYPSPLPENMMEKLREAQIKKELGIPTEQVLRELGYENLELRM